MSEVQYTYLVIRRFQFSFFFLHLNMLNIMMYFFEEGRLSFLTFLIKVVDSVSQLLLPWYPHLPIESYM